MVPGASGTYILRLGCSSSRTILIGRLGSMQLRPGWYVYIGSAFGPGGLGARIGHHRRRAARPHWHIDYLGRYTKLESVWYQCGARREHEWAAGIAAMRGASVVLPGFGSSDCKCDTHLYWFEEMPTAAEFGLVLGREAAMALNLLELQCGKPH